MLKDGSPAPDARFETAEGPASVKDYAGRKLVLYFYPKDDTSGCTREAQDFTALAGEFAAAGAAIVGISKDSVASHKKFQAK